MSQWGSANNEIKLRKETSLAKVVYNTTAEIFTKTAQQSGVPKTQTDLKIETGF